VSAGGYPDAFLRAIIEAPVDDTPRLAYADWLDEKGDPERAEFIRAQVELAKLPADAPGRAALAAKAEALREAHRDAWRGSLPAGDFVATYHRGFAEDVYFHGPRAFFACADELFRRLPVRHLTIHASQGNALDLAGVRALVALPHLARLTALLLWDHPFGDDGIAVLAACPNLVNLRTLSVANCRVGRDGATALAASPYLANLVELDLCGNDIGVDGGRALLAAQHLAALKVLDIGENFYGSEEGEDELLDDMEERFGEGLRFDGSSR
jgi:uncharacterized protein (TIGR02996 family)